ETTDEGDKKTEDEIDTSKATAIITPDEKKEVMNEFEITQEKAEEECDPLTMNCDELQAEAQKLTKQSGVLSTVLNAFDEKSPVYLKATEEKTKVDDKLNEVFDRAFGTCLTPKEEKPKEEPETKE
ncbi:unnamed protein product, partial [marine sediment metagenome]